MKNQLLILFLLMSLYGNTQTIYYEYCFDQTENCYNFIMSDPEPVMNIDVTSNPNNIWQIGTPQKAVLNSSVSSPNVIITDALNTYPINDTSRFTIESTAIQSSSSISWYYFNLSFTYFVDADSLTDFGSIEFSPDDGTTWIDLVNDPNYSSYVEWTVNGGNLPVLTGSSNGWKEASVRMRDLGVLLNIQPGTNFAWRFSFISDAIQNNRDGLMFDNIFIRIDAPVGLEENSLSQSKKLIKVVDLLGRETEIKSNTTLIYVYDDGSTEKVLRQE